MQTRIVQQPKIVEYERPRMIPGKIVRSYNSGAVQTLGVTAVQPNPVSTMSYGYATQPMMGYATQGYSQMGQVQGGQMQGSVPPSFNQGAQV